LVRLLLVVGIVLTSNANFANSYVTDQLREQNITFKTADTLTDEERQSACVVRYAGQQLTTGKQAECYANEFIGLHLKETADGQTYAELGGPQSALRAQVQEAQQTNDPAPPTTWGPHRPRRVSPLNRPAGRHSLPSRHHTAGCRGTAQRRPRRRNGGSAGPPVPHRRIDDVPQRSP